MDDTVSKQDTHFVNVFSAVIGMLALIAVGIFAFSRVVAKHTQDRQVLSEAEYGKRVQARIAQPGQVAIAGQDNSAMAIKVESVGQAGSASVAAMPKNGAELLQQTCDACHGQGIAGAPKVGDKAAWAPRVAEGKATLYDHALKGFQGHSGVMPAQGWPHGHL